MRPPRWSLSLQPQPSSRHGRGILGGAVLFVAACASAPAERVDRQRADIAGDIAGDLAVSDGARELWRGPATFSVRSARQGKAERVVSLPGVGELQAELVDSACRFVWSKDGLGALVLYQGTGCRAPEGGRLCFDGVRFVTDAAAPVPRMLVVDGCADHNDLLWSKLLGSQPATVGPASLRQRCRRLATREGCALTYVKKEQIEVEYNDSGDDGFALVFDDDGWRACFLERESGRYRFMLTVEDACGGRGAALLEGDSADLDD